MTGEVTCAKGLIPSILRLRFCDAIVIGANISSDPSRRFQGKMRALFAHNLAG